MNCPQSLSGGQAVRAGSQEAVGGPAGCWEELAILTLPPGGAPQACCFCLSPALVICLEPGSLDKGGRRPQAQLRFWSPLFLPGWR